MVITQAVHDDLSTRLRVLVAEYAAASDRAGAEAKLAVILERLTVADHGDGPSEEDGRAMVAEIRHRGQLLDDLTASKQVVVDQLEAALKELDAAKAALAETTTALEAATKPKDDQP